MQQQTKTHNSNKRKADEEIYQDDLKQFKLDLNLDDNFTDFDYWFATWHPSDLTSIECDLLLLIEDDE